jgi:Pput_2613-like deaminase
VPPAKQPEQSSPTTASSNNSQKDPKAINWNLTVDYNQRYGDQETDPNKIAQVMSDLKGRIDYHYNRANGLYGQSSDDPAADKKAFDYYQTQMKDWQAQLNKVTGEPTSLEKVAKVGGAAAVGAATGAANDVKGAAEAGKEVGLETADTVNAAAAITGHEIYHGNLSGLGQASANSDFSITQHVAETGANLATAGVYGQVKAGYQLATGQISADEAAKQIGTAGLFQVAAGALGREKGAESSPTEKAANPIGKMEEGDIDRAGNASDRLNARDADAEGTGSSAPATDKQLVPRSGPKGVDPEHHNANVLVQDESGQVVGHERVVSGDMTPEQNAMGFPKGQLASHTEAKAVTATPLKPGESMTITGQEPPCPSCKGYMNRAAKDSGATIQYRWRENGGTKTWTANGGG